MNEGAIRLLLKDLRECSSEFYVTGSVACDVLRRQWTREHKEIGMFMPAECVTKTLECLPSNYTISRKGGVYLVEAGGIEAMIMPLVSKDGTYIHDGLKAVAAYPRAAFTRHHDTKFCDTYFTLASNEVIAATARFEESPDREFIESQPLNIELLDQIIILPKPEQEYPAERLY
jgi:hypothetical protein